MKNNEQHPVNDQGPGSLQTGVRILRYGIPVLFALTITACGGGGGGDEEEEEEFIFDAEATGIWDGTDTRDGGSATGITIVADANGRFAAVGGEIYLFGNGSTSGNSLTATATGWQLPAGTSFPNGSASGNFTLAGNAFDRSRIDASYSGGGISGVLAANYNVAVSDRPSSLAIVEGTYTTSSGNTLTMTNGTINYQVASDPACNGTGSILTHDTSQAVYSWTITTSGCSSVGNGRTDGVAYFLDGASGVNNSLSLLGAFDNSVPFASVLTR